MADPLSTGTAFGTGTATTWGAPAAPNAWGPPVGAPEPQAPAAPPSNQPARKTDLLSIPGNIILDGLESVGALGAMGSLVAARVQEQLHGKPLLRPFPLSPQEPSDLQTAANFAGNIFQQYKQNYYDPIVQGQPGKILEYGAAHPLYFAADVIPVAKALKVPQLLGKAATLARIPQIAARATEGVASVTGKVMTALPEPYAGVLRTELEKAGIAKGVRAELAPDYLQRKTQLHGELLKAYNAVPDAEKPHLMDIAEGTHPALQQGGYQAISLEAREYLRQLRNIIDGPEGMTTRAKSLGVLDDAAIDQARWAPLAGKMTKEQAAALGVEPIYQPRMFEAQAAKAIANPYEINDQLLRVGAIRAEKAAKTAGASAEGARATELLPWEYDRADARGAQFSTNSPFVTIARDIEVARAFALFNFLRKRIEAAAKPMEGISEADRALIAQGKLVPWNPRELLAQMGTRDASILSQLPEQVLMPAEVVDALREYGRGRLFEVPKFYRNIANFARRYLLGFNLALPEVQGAQNFMLLGLSQFKGPRNALLSMQAYMLARDARIQKLIPPGLIEEVFEAEKQGAGFFNFGKHVEGAIDWNFNRLQAYDKYSRMVAATQYAIELSEKMPEFGPLITGMVETGNALNRIEAVFHDAAYAQQVAKRVQTVLGDYSRATAENRAFLRSTLLWWMWYEHIMKFAWHLPDAHPLKTAIIAGSLPTIKEMFQDPNAGDNLNAAGAVPLPGQKNAQGMPYFVMAGSMNPLTSIVELLEMITQPFNDTADASTAIGAANPLIPLGIATLAKRNPATMREWKDPNLVQLAGQQFHREDVLAGRWNPVNPTPPAHELIMRYMLGRPIKALERIAAATAGGEPSQFTSVVPWNPAPRKKFNSFGEPVAPPSWPEIALQILTSSRTVPVDTQSNQMMELMHRKQIMRQGRMMMVRQGFPIQEGDGEQ